MPEPTVVTLLSRDGRDQIYCGLKPNERDCVECSPTVIEPGDMIHLMRCEHNMTMIEKVYSWR